MSILLRNKSLLENSAEPSHRRGLDVSNFLCNCVEYVIKLRRIYECKAIIKIYFFKNIVEKGGGGGTRPQTGGMMM
jgi:hypothetical protein